MTGFVKRPKGLRQAVFSGEREMSTTSTMNVQTTTGKDAPWYQEAFEAFEKRLNGSSGTPLHSLRRAAFRHFAQVGFPTAKDEEWRFTNIVPITRTRFHLAFSPSPEAIRTWAEERWALTGVRSHRLVFIDGHYVPSLSRLLGIPEGVFLGGLADAIKLGIHEVHLHLAQLAQYQVGPFTALNTAFMQDGACVIVPDGVILPDPVHLLFFSSQTLEPSVAQPRNLIVSGRQAKLTVVEEYAGHPGATYLTNAVTELVAGPGAAIEHDRVQEESLAAYHIGSTSVRMLEGSKLTSNSVSLGGAISRNNVTVVFAAEGGECTLNGLSLSSGQQIMDNHTAIDHAHAHCESHELYKAILDGESRGIFNGKILVRKDAQKTDAKQTNKSLLLSGKATIDTKPQLEIFADDVKCTHGATVGQLDEEQVFYLRTRGIGEAEARDVLTFAFAGDIIGRMHIEALHRKLETQIRARLRQGHLSTDE